MNKLACKRTKRYRISRMIISLFIIIFCICVYTAQSAFGVQSQYSTTPVTQSSLLATMVQQLLGSQTIFSEANTEEFVNNAIHQAAQEGVFEDQPAEAFGNNLVPVSVGQGLPSSEIISTLAARPVPKRKGLIYVTPEKYKNLIPTGHAAIGYNNAEIVEAVASGVKKTNNNWQTKRHFYVVRTKGTTISQEETAANWCYSKLNKPYNYNYLNVNTRNSFYCSQLVWAAYKDLYNINMNTNFAAHAIHPMELVNSSKTYTVYQK